jgi:hypothetical protein
MVRGAATPRVSNHEATGYAVKSPIRAVWADYSAVPPRKTTLDMPPPDIAGRMIGIGS